MTNLTLTSYRPVVQRTVLGVLMGIAGLLLILIGKGDILPFVSLSSEPLGYLHTVLGASFIVVAIIMALINLYVLLSKITKTET